MRNTIKTTSMVHVVFVLLCFLGSSVYSVDRNNFKTCEQSNFCKRCRSMNKSQKSAFELLPDSITLTDQYFEAIILNTNYNDVSLRMRLDGLKDSTLRLRINVHGNQMYNRFQPVHALVSEPVTESMNIVRNDSTVELKLNQNIKTYITIAPFKLDVYVGDELTIGVNHDNLMQFEHFRPRPETVSDNEIGSWEEYFKEHQDSKPRGPSAVAMDFKLYTSNYLYGLPEHADNLALKGTVGSEPYRFYNLDVFEYELYNGMALYGAVPFLLGHGKKNSVGVFWLNAAETWVDIGGVKGNSEHTSVVESIVNLVSGGSSVEKDVPTAHFMSENGIIDFFIVLGPRPLDVTRQYSSLTGTAPLPPLFSLAYHQCRWNYNDQKDVHTVETNFDVYDIPMDVMWLDIEYTDSKKYFTWDPIRFSDPLEMINNLTSKGRKLVAIIDPHIKRDSNYFLHNDALNNDLYVKNKDGNVYEGWCWPGSSSYLDFMNPKVQEYYSSRYSMDNFVGPTEDIFIWNDMNEPSVFNGPEVTMPKDCIHHGDYEHRDIHNIYGLLQVMSTYDGLLKRSNGKKRPFILTRSHFAGTQRFSAVWTGDNMAEWSHLKISIPMCLSLAISGISFCGADVGGFFNNPDKELLIRWYQTGAFLPFFRGHAHIDTKRREPWLFDEQTTLLIRDSIRTRYSLLPLWYSVFKNHELTGAPVIRPLFFEFPFEEQLNNIDNEFMIGNALLVCPVLEQNVQELTCYFPGQEEIWYDRDTYQSVKINGLMKISSPINKIPVYQRGGTIVPIKERVRRSSVLMKDDPYTLVVAIDLRGIAKGSLYIDDEESFEYRNGHFVYIEYEYINNQLISKCLHCNGFNTKSWLEKVMIVGIPSVFTKASVQIDGGSSVELSVLYNTSNQVLTVRKPAVGIAQNWTITLL